MEARELAEVAGVHRNTLRVSPGSTRLQQSLRDILRVLSAARELGRSPADALYWMRNHPIAHLGHRSALQLVQSGKTEAVITYLASIDSGYVG